MNGAKKSLSKLVLKSLRSFGVYAPARDLAQRVINLIESNGFVAEWEDVRSTAESLSKDGRSSAARIQRNLLIIERVADYFLIDSKVNRLPDSKFPRKPGGKVSVRTMKKRLAHKRKVSALSFLLIK